MSLQLFCFESNGFLPWFLSCSHKNCDCKNYYSQQRYGDSNSCKRHGIARCWFILFFCVCYFWSLISVNCSGGITRGWMEQLREWIAIAAILATLPSMSMLFVDLIGFAVVNLFWLVFGFFPPTYVKLLEFWGLISTLINIWIINIKHHNGSLRYTAGHSAASVRKIPSEFR